MTGIIKAESLKKIYRNGDIEVEALKGINLEIKKGEFVAIDVYKRQIHQRSGDYRRLPGAVNYYLS